jgi:hypothetical protein
LPTITVTLFTFMEYDVNFFTTIRNN